VTGRATAAVGIVGMGYMGLATGLGFAAHGLAVYGFDSKPEVQIAVARGSAPYHEAGLGKLLRSQVRSHRFRVLDSAEELVDRAQGIFLCVPTPSSPTGRIDLGPLTETAKTIGRALRSVSGYRLIVVKSTVVPGTTEEVVAPLVRRLSGRSSRELGVAANPEFLAEGSMVKDAVHPDRIVIGTSDRWSHAWLNRVYRPFGAPIFNLTPSGAELVKYSANGFLALKVSYANEISRLADRLGISVDAVMAAVGSDPRIGGRFFRAGPGFGGSCFEKDLRAFVKRSKELGLTFRSGEAALQINEDQLDYVIDRIRSSVGTLKGKRLAILGLAFKAGTDDVRGSRALVIAHRLASAGATVTGHDPVALENFRRVWNDLYSSIDGPMELPRTIEGALRGVDAAILQADWPEYRRWRRSWSRRMRRPLLVDLRRTIEPETARRSGLTVVGIGSGRTVGSGAGQRSEA
jgi:UDPglucose 6-dehydrogenase